jgi:hypothetical protein
MAFLRASFFEFLILVHVIGAAVLFRRLFPRESPWLGFFIPALGVMCVFNFLEHYVALPQLGFLLPFTFGGLIWVMLTSPDSWRGLKLAGVLFFIALTFCMALKCISPDIPNWTEGIGDMTRILEYCMGEKVPPTDMWMPPYNRAGYYSFQHYGASLLIRLFSVDIGTGYNLAFALLAALTGLVGAGAAFSVSGKRAWVSAATLFVLMAGSTGGAIFLIFMRQQDHDPDYVLSLALNGGWDEPNWNPFWWIAAHDHFHPWLKLLPPLYTLYYSEYHANLGGAFCVMASLLAGNEIFAPTRTNWSWICLIALPMIVIIMSAWFFFVVLFFCAGSIALALLSGRRPENWRWVVLIGLVTLVLVWPTVSTLIITAAAYPHMFSWATPDFHTPLWMFLVQWWPVYLPWLFLCFVWRDLTLAARWFHAAVPILFLWVEFVTVGDRPLEVEKMWGAIYGAGLVTVLPLAFAQRGLLFRILEVFMLVIMAICFGWWLKVDYSNIDSTVLCRLQGDFYIQADPQRRRLEQVLDRFHDRIVLPGKAVWAYNQAPAVIDFTRNRCYIAWSFQEDECGHPDEPAYREKMNNSFYAGTMADPLAFLRANDIEAVLIWPEDKISDGLLDKFKREIGSDYFYIDCKMDMPDNAGLFVRQRLMAGSPPAPVSVASPVPAPSSGSRRIGF